MVRWILIGFAALSLPVEAAQLRVAVASNFAETMKLLAVAFEKDTGHEVLLSPGSTGKHYAQIRHGAPFDLFFAADTRRPEMLEEDGLIVPGSRFTYAFGKLVLWSPDEAMVDAEGKVLGSQSFRYLAIANPKLAPYGLAAKQVLEQQGLWASLSRRMVRGENIGQTYQYVKSGNAALGFVAASQLMHKGHITEGSFWLVPQRLYSPIEQQGVMLVESEAARAFFSYMQSDRVRALIRGSGYETAHVE